MKPRVVLAVESAKLRALARLGLDTSGDFDVVGVAVDERDLRFVVETLRPDVTIVDFPSAEARGLHLVVTATEAFPGTVVVLFEALAAQHHAATGTDAVPRPVEIARLLRSALDERAPAPV